MVEGKIDGRKTPGPAEGPHATLSSHSDCRGGLWCRGHPEPLSGRPFGIKYNDQSASNPGFGRGEPRLGSIFSRALSADVGVALLFFLPMRIIGAPVTLDRVTGLKMAGKPHRLNWRVTNPAKYSFRTASRNHPK